MNPLQWKNLYFTTSMVAVSFLLRMIIGHRYWVETAFIGLIPYLLVVETNPVSRGLLVFALIVLFVKIIQDQKKEASAKTSSTETVDEEAEPAPSMHIPRQPA